VKRPTIKRPSVPADERIPRGAIAVVVVGVIATIAAALLSSSGSGGSAAHLEWVQQRKLPDSKQVAVPGSPSSKLQLVDAKIQSTGSNVAGYALFRVLATAKIDKGVKFDEGTTLLCSIHTGVLIAQSTGGLRMLYPRSSETGIYGQPVEEEVVAQFASHGHLAAVLLVNENLRARYTTIQGVKLEWPEYEVGTAKLEYLLPQGTPKTTIELPFYAIWKSTKRPSASVSCELSSSAGKAKVETKGHLDAVAPPIDEEAEEENADQREEESEATEEKESEEGG
jgi:hypothetical protein